MTLTLTQLIIGALLSAAVGYVARILRTRPRNGIPAPSPTPTPAPSPMPIPLPSPLLDELLKLLRKLAGESPMTEAMPPVQTAVHSWRVIPAQLVPVPPEEL